MSESSFETELQRLFAEAPPLPDAVGFAAAVETRLERGWRMRRLLIGAAGSVGGLLAAFQIVQANLVGRAAEASHVADDRAQDLLAALLVRAASVLHLHGLAAGGEAVWMAAGLGAVGLALAAARIIEAL